jgi:hypothetical protein
VTHDTRQKIHLTHQKTHKIQPKKLIFNAQNPFLMPKSVSNTTKIVSNARKIIFYSNLKPRRGRLTFRGFYHPNVKKNNAGKMTPSPEKMTPRRCWAKASGVDSDGQQWLWSVASISA